MNIIEISNNFCFNYFSCLRKASSSLGITQAQAACIFAIPFAGISQSSLSKKLSIDLSTLSRNLDNLIKRNLINKSLSMIDKRSYKIRLTNKGIQLQQQFNNQIISQLSECFDSLSDEENNQLEELLNKINWELELRNQ